MRPIAALLVLTACPPEPEPPPPPPPGCLQVNRSLIEFGAVRVGVTHDIVLRVTNECPPGSEDLGPVTIDSIQFDTGFPPFYTTPASSSVISRGQSAFLQIAFSPTEDGVRTDTLRIRSNSTTDPDLAVAISGTGATATIGVDPLQIDFGTPLIGCRVSAPVTITNEGSYPLQVTGASVSDRQRFRVELDDDRRFPLIVPPASQEEIRVSFRPVALAERTTTLGIYSDDPTSENTPVLLTGAGEFHQAEVQSEVFDAYTDAHMVLTLSRAPSMDDDRDDVLAGLTDFAARLAEVDGDPRVALVVADDGCVVGPDRWIDRSFTAEEAAAALITMADLDFELAPAGDATEAGFDLADRALSDENLGPGGCNEGLVRDGERLVVASIADTGDASEHTHSWYPVQWRDLSGDDVVIHGISGDWPSGCDTALPGSGYYDAAQATQGGYHSICDSRWGSALALPELAPNRETSVALAQVPVFETLEVRADGELQTSGWYYVPADNTVVVLPAAAPRRGGELEIRYNVQPDCEQ